ncbi:unnamed protein product [Prorocentrum cordatum]|uniref:Uncharacterized protein n=1 Tax=Prorocentrum cordatum TaxID=2364126 RepID=A0ABN9U2N8_9DINO|nr:unnamed protein product [Polarella glacialis]
MSPTCVPTCAFAASPGASSAVAAADGARSCRVGHSLVSQRPQESLGPEQRQKVLVSLTERAVRPSELGCVTEVDPTALQAPTAASEPRGDEPGAVAEASSRGQNCFAPLPAASQKTALVATLTASPVANNGSPPAAGLAASSAAKNENPPTTIAESVSDSPGVASQRSPGSPVSPQRQRVFVSLVEGALRPSELSGDAVVEPTTLQAPAASSQTCGDERGAGAEAGQRGENDLARDSPAAVGAQSFSDSPGVASQRSQGSPSSPQRQRVFMSLVEGALRPSKPRGGAVMDPTTRQTPTAALEPCGEEPGADADAGRRGQHDLALDSPAAAGAQGFSDSPGVASQRSQGSPSSPQSQSAFVSLVEGALRPGGSGTKPGSP